MPYPQLVHHHGLRATHFVEANDVKATPALYGLRVVSLGHGDDRVGKQGRQLGALAPAERPAFQGGLCVGVSERQLRETVSVLESLIHLVDSRLRLIDLLATGRGCDADQYV